MLSQKPQYEWMEVLSENAQTTDEQAAVDEMSWMIMFDDMDCNAMHTSCVEYLDKL